MNFNPEEKLKELFKKHMDIGDADKKPFMGTDETEFDELFYHQHEYFGWTLEKGKIIFNCRSGMDEPMLMGIFHRQDDKLPLINKEFTLYVNQAIEYLTDKVKLASTNFSESGIPCEKLYLCHPWNLIAEQKFLETQVIWSNDIHSLNRIESPSGFGRFIDFEL